jgi:hypothetical protein
MHLIPTVPFTEEELLSKNPTRQTLKKIEVFKSTVVRNSCRAAKKCRKGRHGSHCHTQ